ncbi:hypothetical protein [Azotosporobacter soli]|uniref:hypothetical protein n=1 Tax=Azotosporobacter soli TaxID=3055040 RepID=UPI0031FF28D8
MSAFLGHIHYWLYHKIERVVEREELLYQAAAQNCGDTAEELRQQVWQIYGQPLPANSDLGEHIDQRNIHGWLQRQIMLAETREAAFIKELCDACGGLAEGLVEETFRQHGALCGQAAQQAGKHALDSAKSIYQALNDFFLNGMPCDEGDQVAKESPELLSWTGVCHQERNWLRGGMDKERMQSWQQLWLESFVAAANPAYQYQSVGSSQEIKRK